MSVSACSFPYRWRLSDLPKENNGLSVFGTFVCGGGSAMGYKLAGFDYLGGVEIDKKVSKVYQKNLHPKFFYNEDIRDFLLREEYPAELKNLDVLDGSPPCTLFTSNRGKKREKDWGKARKFKEGQEKQTLDDLPFVYGMLIEKLKPKVFVFENVEGILMGGGKKICC